MLPWSRPGESLKMIAPVPAPGLIHSDILSPKVLISSDRSGLPRLPQRTQRISQHDSLPTEKLQRQVVALRQGAAFIICRQQVVRARAAHQKRLVNVAGG